MSLQLVLDEQALLAPLGGRSGVICTLDDSVQALDRELERWLDPLTPACDLQPLVLARLVTHEVRRSGKHFLPAELLDRLDAVRSRHRGRDEYLDAFLDCLLDKHDGVFWNRTYLFLPLLEVVLAKNEAMLPAELAGLLVADIIRHELCAAHRLERVDVLGRPDARTLRTRMRHAVRFLTLHLGDTDDEPLFSAIAGDLDDHSLTVLPLLPKPRGGTVAEWLDVTVQAVSVVHDEHFFIRVLQAHEISFAAINRRVRAAIGAMRGDDLDTAATLLHECLTFMESNATLFRLVATMRPEAFHSFREFTDGASAIQSEQYKRFEGLCGLPPEPRIKSPAFESVPAVRDEVRRGQDTLSDAYADLRDSGHDPAGTESVRGLLRALEASHRRWKSTHVTLATRMLGEDAPGSGHTCGVGYLRQWVDHRLFWRLDDLG